MPAPDSKDFRCNICNAFNQNVLATAFGREGASCQACGSSVRLRGIIHHLSSGLFGVSVPLMEFPIRKDISGLGLSDWTGYADTLAARLSYTNTFYHQEPYLDIAAPDFERWHAKVNFLLSSDVFEHVPPPVSRAFAASFKLLQPGGLLVLTVPFTDVPQTVEHYSDLHQWKVVELDGEYVLVNRDLKGRYSVRDKLVFHGGPGDTLELREFSRDATVTMLKKAGFVDIQVHDGVVPEWGIFPPHHHGLPITARRPQ